tara:strand:- start:730 stop:1254 length:525 start_codon:yes stop_codon:yes gene_type:complete
MITTEGNYSPRPGYADEYIQNGNGGIIRKSGQPAPFRPDNSETKYRSVELLSYNVGFGSTMPTAAWVDWTAAQCDIAGISTAGMDPTRPKQTKKVQINIPAANIATVRYYGDKKCGDIPGFFDLYEKADERKARHAALRAAGFKPPFPRADKFYQNKHQGEVQAGLSTSPHNMS